MPTIKTDLEQRLFNALKEISQYQTAERLLKKSWDDWGLDNGHEALEYAYENVRELAARSIKGIRKRKVTETGRSALEKK